MALFYQELPLQPSWILAHPLVVGAAPIELQPTILNILHYLAHFAFAYLYTCSSTCCRCCIRLSPIRKCPLPPSVSHTSNHIVVERRVKWKIHISSLNLALLKYFYLKVWNTDHSRNSSIFNPLVDILDHLLFLWSNPQELLINKTFLFCGKVIHTSEELFPNKLTLG